MLYPQALLSTSITPPSTRLPDPGFSHDWPWALPTACQPSLQRGVRAVSPRLKERTQEALLPHLAGRVLSLLARPKADTLDGPLAKGGLNGGHPPPLPCELPMGGFPCEFGPETEREIPGHGGPIFSAHRLEGRFSGPRPHLEAPAASSHRATSAKIF